MFIQTEITPNPNSLKFLPGKKVSNSGSYEITKKDTIKNELVRNLLSINGVTGVFLSSDFLSVNKKKDVDWENIKHIVISHINEYYAEGNEFMSNLFSTFSASMAEDAFTPPLIPEWIPFSNIIFPELQAAIVGDKSVKEALDDAAKETDYLMQDAGYY